MKTNTKKRATRTNPRGPRENKPIPHTKKTRALPVKPPESANDEIYAHVPDLQICTSHGPPPDGLPPTPVELLAFATAIHGPGPLPKNPKALEQLFAQAHFLWQKSHYQIKTYSERLRRLQEEMVPVLTKDDPWSKQFKSLGGFFIHVTGLTNSGDAKREFRKWLDSKKVKYPEKKIEYFKRTFVDAVGFRPFLEGMKRMLSDWHQENVKTSSRNSATRKKCYAFVRKVTGLKKDKDNEKEKALIEEWRKHEATTGHQTGEGAALLERLHERFEPWWKEKQTVNANGKDAPKSSRRPASKKRGKKF